MRKDYLQEAQMQLHFGADIRGREGEKLGDLRRVLFDPATNEVTALVVQHSGFDGRRMLVPVGAIDSADQDGVELALSRTQFDDLEDAGEAVNIAPPPSADNLEAGDDIAPAEVPDVPAVGAATGVESIAFTPVLEEITSGADESNSIDGDTVIQATDGELGRLAEVLIDDETRRIEGFGVVKGLFLKSNIVVPLDTVAGIEPGTIALNVGRGTLEGERAGE